MRLYEGHNIGGERPSREQIGSRLRMRHGHALRWLFAGNAGRGGRLRSSAARRSAQAVLKDHRQSCAPCVVYIEVLRSCPENLVSIVVMR